MEVHQTNKQAIREYLQAHPTATRNEIAAATGRKIHYPDLTAVKRELGLIHKRVKRRKPKNKAQSVKVVTHAVRNQQGLILLGAVLDLAKSYGGAKKLKAVVDAVASF